jgi:hypothetical protein
LKVLFAILCARNTSIRYTLLPDNEESDLTDLMPKTETVILRTVGCNHSPTGKGFKILFGDSSQQVQCELTQ